LPMELFRGKPWRAEPGAKYVKLHMHFQEDVELTNIGVTFCEKTSEPFAWYANFDEARGTMDGQGNANPASPRGAAPNLGLGKTPPNAEWGFAVTPPPDDGPSDPLPGLGVHSLTINFLRNTAVCVKQIQFFYNEAAIEAVRARNEALETDDKIPVPKP